MHDLQKFPALEKSFDYTSDYYEPDPELAETGPWLNNGDFDVLALRRVLVAGIEFTWDELFYQVHTLVECAETPQFAEAQLLARAELSLPLPRSDDLAIWLLRRLDVCLIQVVANMTSDHWQSPRCRGQEWAFHQILATSLGTLKATPEEFDQVDALRLETLIEVVTSLRDDYCFADDDYVTAVELFADRFDDLGQVAVDAFWFDELPAANDGPHPLVGPGFDRRPAG
jgi:hypothetical protein